MTTRQADQVVRKPLADNGNSSSDDEDDKDKENNQSLMVKEETDSKKILALMANSDSKFVNDNCEVNFFREQE